MTRTSSDAFRVLVVDDSASARIMMRRIVESDPGLSVMGLASDAYAAARMMIDELPDVILLDLEMPLMDGITFLRKIMAQHPIPVVICSSLTEQGSRRSVEAMEAGALGVIRKPSVADPEALRDATAQICDSLRAAAMSQRTSRQKLPTLDTLITVPKLTADAILPAPNPNRRFPRTEPVVCIGASTGGTEALTRVLCALPADAPATLVVQHMPKGFTRAFANRLNGLANIEIVEAEEGMVVQQGRCIIAAGDTHLMLHRTPSGYRAQVSEGPLVSRHRPSVDVLFRSAAIHAGPNALGIILTGMGADGAACLGEMLATGAHTIAQNEETCVVFGMPREAIALGHAKQTLPLDKIAGAITGFGRLHATSGASR